MYDKSSIKGLGIDVKMWKSVHGDNNWSHWVVLIPKLSESLFIKSLPQSNPTTRYATWKKYTATIQKAGCINVLKWSNAQGQNPKQLHRVWFRKINVQVYIPPLEVTIRCMAYIQRMTLFLYKVNTTYSPFYTWEHRGTFCLQDQNFLRIIRLGTWRTY